MTRIRLLSGPSTAGSALACLRAVPRHRSARLPLVVLALLAPATLSAVAHAASSPTPPPKLEPTVLRAARTGIRSVDTRVPAIDRAPVVLRLTAPPTTATLAKLTAAGAELAYDGATPLFYQRNVPAHVSERAALALAALPEVERIALAPAARTQPIAHSAELMRLADARGARPALDLLTGAGVTVGDVDSLVDVFHPAMFRGDAGYFDWIDVDHDGRFTPGVDAVDLDRDGQVGAGELAMPLKASTWDWSNEVSARSGDFDPGTDWVWLDTNDNGKRDYGASAGFDDATPAFGEPLFVPDDLNRNGALDPGERLVRLGTSKYRKVRVHVTYLAKVNHTYVRGVDLSSTPVDLTGGQLYGFPDAFHATGVTSIMAGDLPLAGRRWVGIAPDVELVESFDVDQTSEQLPATATTWALKEKADVMLYELAPWTGLPLDGSDPLSQIIDDSATSQGVAHACPTGDEAAARKHAQAKLAAGASAELPFDLPSRTASGAGPLTYVNLTAHVRAGDVASLTLTGPGGISIALTDGVNDPLTGGGQTYVSVQTTARGTRMYDVYLYLPSSAPSGSALPVGAWKLAAKNGASAVTLDAYLNDDKSSWAMGAAWDKSVATDVSTVGVPSVADHCLGVGAAPDHPQDPSAPWFDTSFYYAYDVPASWRETQLQVRAYSPRGPRIDGAIKPDILAPDNPWAAAPAVDSGAYKFPHGAFDVFGGTSGAGPHVAGVEALLAQAGIRGDAAHDAIRKGAAKGAGTAALPNGDYGQGLLDAAGAFGVTGAGETPTIALTVSSATPTVGAQVTITPVVAGGSGLEVKWDDDYDGTWDVAYAAAAPRTVSLATTGVQRFKVRVRNASGRFAEALAILTYVEAPKPSEGGCGCGVIGRTGGATAAAAMSAFVGLAIARRRRRARA
jgi:hypothetical protein